MPANSTEPDTLVLGSSGHLGAAICSFSGAQTVSRLKDNSSIAGASLSRKLDGRAVVVAASQVPVPHDGHPSFLANLKILNPLLDASPEYVCYLSSDAVYPFDREVTETTELGPSTAYARMHLMRERALIDHFEQRLLIVRLSQVYGAGDRHNAYGPMQMLRAAISRGKITLFGQGEERRDHIYVDDAAQAIVALLKKRHTGLVNVAFGHSVTFAEICRTVSLFVPANVEHEPRQQSVTHRDININTLRNVIPAFAPRDLKAGLSETFQRMSTHE